MSNQGETMIDASNQTRTKIAQINDLIESLPQDKQIYWLAGDGSWGGLPGLGLYLPEQITEDMREQYGMLLTEDELAEMHEL